MSREWTLTVDSLPPEPKHFYGLTYYLATVEGLNKVIALSYRKIKLRGKEVIRWEWDQKPCPWEVIAWMPFPEPYKLID